MEWFRYNYDLIEAGEIRGEIKGKTIGKQEEQKTRIRNLYEIAMMSGTEKEDALSFIEQKYPEYSTSAIHEILNI